MQGAIKIRSDLRAVNYVKPTQVLKATLIASGPSQVVATAGTFFRVARVIGCKDLAGTANTGTVKVGWNSAASNQPIVITTGAEKIIEAPVGASHDLSELYVVVATDNDGVVVVYS